MTPDVAGLIARLGEAVREYDEAVARPPHRDASNDALMADVAMAHGHLFSQAAAALAAMAMERDDAVRRMEQGWVQVCAEPAIKHFKDAAEQAERERDEAQEQFQSLRDATRNLLTTIDEAARQTLLDVGGAVLRLRTAIDAARNGS